MEKRKLQIWSAELGPQVDPMDLPTPEEVLYQKPNSDMSRKRCGNCVLYSTQDRSCSIMDAALDIDPNMICGYYVFGLPMSERAVFVGMDPVSPEFAGLCETSEGTSCDLCVHFSEPSLCDAVQQDGSYATVDPLGCCNRWCPIE